MCANRDDGRPAFTAFFAPQRRTPAAAAQKRRGPGEPGPRIAASANDRDYGLKSVEIDEYTSAKRE
jgi:hypothetical protein